MLMDSRFLYSTFKKSLTKPVKIRYYKLEFMHVWQSDSLGNVSHMVPEMAILFCYFLGPFMGRHSKNEKSVKLLFTISRPNLNGFQLTMLLLKRLPEPVKISYCDKKSIDIYKSTVSGLHTVQNILYTDSAAFFLYTAKGLIASGRPPQCHGLIPYSGCSN